MNNLALVCFTLVSLCTWQLASAKTYSVKGSIMLDASATGPFYDNKDENINEYTLRSSKLAIEYKPLKQLKSKLQLQYDSDIHDKDSITLDDVTSDAYLDMKIPKIVNIRLGKMKEVAGFERSSSSKNLSTTERSMVSSTFFSGRNLGVKVYKHQQGYGWETGWYDDSEDNRSSLHGAGYFNFEPLIMGLTVIKQDLNDELFQLKSSGEMNTADNIIRSARFYAQDSLTLQLDSLLQFNHWRLHTSYASMLIQQTQGDEYQYQGGFIQLSHSPSSVYVFAKGKQKQLKRGWEYVARVSVLDLMDADTGSEASVITFGSNYYQGNGFKYMASFLIPQIKGQVRSANQDGYGFNARVQYQF